MDMPRKQLTPQEIRLIAASAGVDTGTVRRYMKGLKGRTSTTIAIEREIEKLAQQASQKAS